VKIAAFSTRSYDREFLSAAAGANATFNASHHFDFYDVHLRPETLHLTKGYDAICAFVNDRVDRAALENLKKGGTQLVALRCAGYNNVDLIAANDLGIPVVRIPAYSPEAVAEHTVALILTLNRKIYRAYRQVREGNFSLDGLVGFNLHCNAESYADGKKITLAKKMTQIPERTIPITPAMVGVNGHLLIR
jgi:D-lactate dehydrogenase